MSIKHFTVLGADTDINVRAVCVIPSISFNPLDRQLKLPCGTHLFSGFKICSSFPRSLKELFAGSLGQMVVWFVPDSP